MTFPAAFPIPDCLSVPELAALVAADFVERGVTIPVEFGAFNLSGHKGPSKVTLSLDDYEFDGPGPAGATGPHVVSSAHAAQIEAWYTARGVVLPDALTGFAARSLFSCVQGAIVTCFAEPDPNQKAANRTVLAHQNAAKLRGLSAAALYRVAHGSLSLSLGRGKWPSSHEVQGIVYGSLTFYTVQFWIPVLDDPQPMIQGDPVTSVTAVFWNGPSGSTEAVTTPDP